MPPLSRFVVCRFGCPAAAVALVVYSALAASAQSEVAHDTAAIGRIDFAQGNLPPATVEVELGPGMIGDLLGLGKAAIAGVAETLIESSQASETTKLAADQLQAVQEIVAIAGDVVQEVRVRVYEEGSPAFSAQFASQLKAGKWSTIVRVHEGSDSVEFSLVRLDGAVRGVFVVAADGNDLVLVNVVCNVSAEKIQALTAKAAQIGLDNGLQRLIEGKLQHLRRNQAHGHTDSGRHEAKQND